MEIEEPEPGKIHISGTGEYTVTTNGAMMGGIGLETGGHGFDPQDVIEGDTLEGEVIGGTDTDTVEFYGTPEGIEYDGRIDVEAEPINNGEPIGVEQALYIFYNHGQDWDAVPGFDGWQDVSQYSEDKIIQAVQSIGAANAGDTAWISERPWFDRSNVSPENIPDIRGLAWDAPDNDMPDENESENGTDEEPPETGPDSENEPMDQDPEWVGNDNEVDLGEFAPPGEDYGSAPDGPTLPSPESLFDQLRSLFNERNWIAIIGVFVAVFVGFFIAANLLGRTLGIWLGEVLREA